MKYEWDEKKRATNISRHGVDFVVISSFDWVKCLTVIDDRFNEYRYRSMGCVGSRLYVLTYTVRKETIRLISLRKANKREIKKYETYISR